MVKRQSKRQSKREFKDTWFGQRVTSFIDKLEPKTLGIAAKHGAVILPFVLAERKTGGYGFAGAATGILADRLIEEKVDLPQISILGSTIQINAGYAMLAGVLTFLGINGLFYGLGLDLTDVITSKTAGTAAAQMMKDQEQAARDYQAGKIDKATYLQSKVWRR